MMKTIKCESQYKNVQSNYIKHGIREDSWGISQINLYYNPEITLDQTLDPEFSINFMAEQFSKGQARKWSCYRLLY